MIVLFAAIAFWLAVGVLAAISVMPLGSKIDRLLADERPVRDECDCRLRLYGRNVKRSGAAGTARSMTQGVKP